MKLRRVVFDLMVYDSMGELEQEDQVLILEAVKARQNAYSPYSKFNLDIDKKSPGAIGRWLGYRIVDSYMKNNKIDLKELINLDHYTIFKKSKYKPYK